jgi:hypothetical protein
MLPTCKQSVGEIGLRGSTSRRGNPYNNAKAESFMKTLKCDHVYLNEYRNFQGVERVPVLIDQGLQLAQIGFGTRVFTTSAIRGATHAAAGTVFPPENPSSPRVHSTRASTTIVVGRLQSLKRRDYGRPLTNGSTVTVPA